MLHTLLHNKLHTCSCARFCGIRLLSFERELAENLDYKSICEAPLSQTKVMLYNKLTLGNALTNINNEK